MQTIAQQLKIKKFPFIINDHNGNQIYYENSDGFWWKHEFDSNGNTIYYENSNGIMYDKRSVELTMDEIAKKLGIDVNLLKIKKVTKRLEIRD
jgi:hypothetical protein